MYGCMYESFSVGCYDLWSRRSGRDFETRVEADDYFNQAIRSGRVISAAVYGWAANSECDELRSWVA